MRFATLTAVCFLLVSGLLRGAEPRPLSPQSDETIVPADWQALHDRWQAAVKELRIPGLAVVAVKGGEVVLLDTIGVCDPIGNQPVTPRSPFYLASVTKSFTALGVAILVDEGKIKLDEPVKTYLPRFTLADKELAANISVRDLLSHRYGLDSSPISMAEAYFGNITEDRYYFLLQFVEPLGKFSYSNLHYTLAGRIIQAVSGKPWQDFLAERVFTPLGMRDSTCYASRLYANPMAAWPIVEDHGKWKVAPLVKNDAVMHAAGGMGASAADMSHWLRFQITGKTPSGQSLISPKLLRDVQTQQVVDGSSDSAKSSSIKRDGYSLGWFTGTFHGRRYLTHGGGYVGTATYVSFLPDDKLGVAVLMNEGSPNAMFPSVVASDVYGKLLGESLPDQLPRAREVAALVRQKMSERVELHWNEFASGAGLSQPIERYAGTYQSPFWGELHVSVADNKLVLRIGGLKLRGHGLGDDRLRLQLLPGDILEGSFRLNDAEQVTDMVVQTPEGEAELRKIR